MALHLAKLKMLKMEQNSEWTKLQVVREENIGGCHQILFVKCVPSPLTCRIRKGNFETA